MKKEELRKHYHELRKNLNKSQYWDLNDLLLEQAKQIDWSNYTHLHMFLPVSEKNEPDTFEFLQYFKKEYPYLLLSVPKIKFEDLSMVNLSYSHLYTVLRKNKFGIPEPIYGDIMHPQVFDAVLVPLLAFDETGERVGYGKGFYDKFLALCKPSIEKIGVSLFDPVAKIDDAAAHDVKLTSCITPNKTWQFEAVLEA